MKQTRLTGWHCTLILGLATFCTSAQDDLLKGPSIGDSPTITRYTMSGEFEQIAGRPEIAAFAVIAKDTGLMDRAIEIELERTVSLSMLLVDQIDLMKESTDAMTAGDNSKSNQIQGRLHEMFDPKKRHDPLTPELMRLLNKNQQAQYKRVLESYWDAWIDASLGERMNQQEPKVRERTRARLTRNLFFRELRDAYDISLRQYRESIERIYSVVNPTDEQREKMRDILITYIKQTRLEPTSQQRRAATIQMYEVLDEERRTAFFEYLLQIVVPDDQ